MRDDAKPTSGDPEFDAVYRELVFLHMTAEHGGKLLFRLLFLGLCLQSIIVILLAVLAFRGG